MRSQIPTDEKLYTNSKKELKFEKKYIYIHPMSDVVYEMDFLTS